MNPAGPDYFGEPLRPDPAIALAPIEVTIPLKSGPLHRVQFVIEFVGPRSVPALAAIHLLGSEWYSALGQPFIHAMRPADLHWHPLTNSTDGSYDSLALSWDLLSPKGQETLFDPGSRRLPVNPAVYDKAPAGYPNPFKDPRLNAMIKFDVKTSEHRNNVVDALFDQIVTFQLADLKGATKAIDDAEAALAKKDNAQGRALVKEQFAEVAR